MAAKNVEKQQVVLAITSNDEGHKLWRHVMVGTGTCLSMVEQYAELNMPGIPISGLYGLRDRLDQVIKQQEERNASTSSAE